MMNALLKATHIKSAAALICCRCFILKKKKGPVHFFFHRFPSIATAWFVSSGSVDRITFCSFIISPRIACPPPNKHSSLWANRASADLAFYSRELSSGRAQASFSKHITYICDEQLSFMLWIFLLSAILLFYYQPFWWTYTSCSKGCSQGPCAELPHMQHCIKTSC